MRKLILSAAVLAAATGVIGSARAAEPAPAAAPATAPQSSDCRAKMMFWFLDRNGDGFIDVAEIEAARTARFKAMDVDGDGKLTKAEATAAIDSGRWHRGHGQADATKAAMWADKRAKREAAALKRFGFTDQVESLTLAEFVGQDNSLLKRADTNGDGKISEAEFLALRDKAGNRQPN